MNVRIIRHPEVDLGRVGMVDFVPEFVETKVYDKVFKLLGLFLLNQGIPEQFLMERFDVNNVRPLDRIIVGRYLCHKPKKVSTI